MNEYDEAIASMYRRYGVKLAAACGCQRGLYHQSIAILVLDHKAEMLAKDIMRIHHPSMGERWAVFPKLLRDLDPEYREMDAADANAFRLLVGRWLDALKG